MNLTSFIYMYKYSNYKFSYLITLYLLMPWLLDSICDEYKQNNKLRWRREIY